MNYLVGIDPSTSTGIVILDRFGNVLTKTSKELPTGIKSSDKEMMDYALQILGEIPKKDEALVCIEGFSLGSTGQGVSLQFGIGYALRFMMLSLGIPYLQVPPTQLKKFATGKGAVSKDNMVLPIFKQWNFEHDSDDVRDAFVLAQIAKVLDREGIATQLKPYQMEVIQALKNNPAEKTKKKRK